MYERTSTVTKFTPPQQFFRNSNPAARSSRSVGGSIAVV